VGGPPRHGPRSSLSKADAAIAAAFHRLEDAHDLAWTLLIRAVRDRRAAWRTPALATVSRKGGAEVRTVVLRRVDRGAGAFRFHTDRRSAKVAAIAACPEVATARLIADGPEVAAAWAAVPEAARMNYRTADAPGSALPLAGPAPEAGDGLANFTLLEVVAEGLDLLWLGPGGHRRAGWVRRPDGWAGGWRVP
jgi:hypothetical protein